MRLEVGTRVVHKKFGIGTVIEDDGSGFMPYLVRFDVQSRELHNGELAREDLSNRCWWFDEEGLRPFGIEVL